MYIYIHIYMASAIKFKVTTSLENFALRMGGGCGIFRNEGLPEMEGVVFEMEVLTPLQTMHPPVLIYRGVEIFEKS